MDAEAQLEGFIGKYAEQIQVQIRAARLAMRRRFPGAIELVYDNYNALAIGYGPTERASDIIASIAAYPRWISLFLMGGPSLDDPRGLLKGAGGSVRHIVLTDPSQLDDVDVVDLIEQAKARAQPPLDPAQPFRSVIKSISAKQRPRRPSATR